MQLANEGDIRPFIRFIAECTEKTLDLYLWATSDLPKQIPLLSQPSEDEDIESENFSGDFEDGSTIRVHT